MYCYDFDKDGSHLYLWSNVGVNDMLISCRKAYCW